MIEVKNLTKRYGDIKALDDISFTVDTGEVLGFLGPNGAGKSTTMNIITGYISSTSGTVTVDGTEILENPRETKRKIGYLPEIPPLYPEMTVRKYLEFMFDLKKVKLPKKEHIEEIMRLVRITDMADRLIKNLSKGYRQRVGFGQALLGNPPVLILDEPTVGLDPKQIIEIRKLIRSLGKKHTVIFSSHVLSEISATCDRIIVISEGRLVADSKADELSKALADTQKLSLTVEGSPSDVLGEIKKIPGVKKYMKVRELGEKSAVYSVEYGNEFDIRREVFSAMARINAPILEMKSGNESLEDMFLKLTQGAGKAGR
ncbi:ABC transporter ATP-binding protein [Ruminococcus difficilis]|jgi:ABC-2 type transport system ATP-binding protein|uniref:ATP-binding cassette domain-containing protein n=1 Tax=Ruminococcus difficilis TaxID=2763069 RepID=A0A935C2Y8_9FIRM|nr:ATP-binding cassette domain-containing protein [Ruminococcus difficilis]MBQ1354608.1 ATP-binding cassette domain-containing protein [Ruminococcus sp.]MDO4892245.1 ATP-binding cassette domain-containing protein [Eubacteriales bacterium]MBK6089475.1 ATP-binding cassette domain-containing protein [Ruminococcus difficilis]MBQ1586021.1 ATP-binding cassette domain-containing protein [Ruminococcus sp.]MBQ1594181.1 ATP-binding cassette domain-containing protein [Ruminococcus sp.]